jgi:hypothetical protein
VNIWKIQKTDYERLRNNPFEKTTMIN